METLMEDYRLAFTAHCQHLRRQGDNYGVNCLDCGVAIAGYGYWGEGRMSCLHSWITNGEELQQVMCMYCQAVRTGGVQPW